MFDHQSSQHSYSTTQAFRAQSPRLGTLALGAVNKIPVAAVAFALTIVVTCVFLSPIWRATVCYTLVGGCRTIAARRTFITSGLLPGTPPRLVVNRDWGPVVVVYIASAGIPPGPSDAFFSISNFSLHTNQFYYYVFT